MIKIVNIRKNPLAYLNQMLLNKNNLRYVEIKEIMFPFTNLNFSDILKYPDWQMSAEAVTSYQLDNQTRDISTFIYTLATPGFTPSLLPVYGAWTTGISYDENGVMMIPEDISSLLFQIEKFDARAKRYFNPYCGYSHDNEFGSDPNSPGSPHWRPEYKLRIEDGEEELATGVSKEDYVIYNNKNKIATIQAAYHDGVMIIGSNPCKNSENYSKGILAGLIADFSRDVPLENIEVITTKNKFTYNNLNKFSL